ncbi:hypothetical protein [Saccharopolyspora sp. NPDC002376]
MADGSVPHAAAGNELAARAGVDIERAVACVVGGGGLGDIAIASSHQRFAV